MCGIVGYVGGRSGQSVVLEALGRLEYRGYDSAGMAAVADGSLAYRKVEGKLDGLRSALQREPLAGSTVIGHTRWATHGRPSQVNAHPHVSCDGGVAVVHNGIIENFAELRARLTADGHVFVSQTDSETIVHLIEDHYDGDLREAVRRAVRELVGAFSLGVVAADSPDEIVAVRRFSPLVIGLGDDENYIASDMGAIRAETDRVLVIDDDELCRVRRDGVELTDLDLKPVSREVTTIPWPATAAERGGHEKFMHKEIFEQPEAMRVCLAGRLVDADAPISLENTGLTEAMVRGLDRVIFTACGTAYHAGWLGSILVNKLAGMSAAAELAAEARVRDTRIPENTLCVVISQSGETADTLEALRCFRAKGAHVLGIINVVDSSIARESDGVVYIHAGPEIGVASTKAYTLQLLTVTLFALWLGEIRGAISADDSSALKRALLATPDQAEELLRREGDIIRIAEKHSRKDNALYLARGGHLPTVAEGALKLKEISYVHAEACSAGEMKHGPIALVSPEMFTLAVAVPGSVYTDMLGNILEIKARGGPVVAVAIDGDETVAALGADATADPSDASSVANDMIWVPATDELISPILIAIPLQLLAYHIAHQRGEHIDQPRNLAKTVTVK